MSIVTFYENPQFPGLYGVVTYAPGQTFNVGAAILAGSGSFTVDTAASPLLYQFLINYLGVTLNPAPEPAGGSGGLTSFQGRTTPAAVLTKTDVTGTGLAYSDVGADAAGAAAAAQSNAEAASIPLASLGAPSGAASLDGSGKLPASQLTVDAMEYKGAWNASTNTPTLANGSGSPGDFYEVSVAGTQNLGAGNITFSVGDHVILNPSLVYEQIPAGTMTTLRTVTAATTIVSGDANKVIQLDASSAAFSQPLPSAATFVGSLTLVAITTSTNLVSLTTTGSQTIGGLGVNPTSVLALGTAASGALCQSVVLVPDGTNWRVVG
jgi:hypothetical protein